MPDKININAYEPELKSLVDDFREAKNYYKKLNTLESKKESIVSRRRNVYNRKRAYKSKKKLSAGPPLANVSSGQGTGDTGAFNQENSPES